MPDSLSSGQWDFYEANGYVVLGDVLAPAQLKALQTRIDDIMLGRAKVDYSRLLMQLDSETGKYDDAGEQTLGHKGVTLNYRKIQELEHDALFLEFMQRPIFRHICDRVYGTGTPISSFRAMFMNKPAGKGTFLPWHQDRWNYLNKDPEITTWTALDAATRANGCVQVIPGSHKLGLINTAHASGFLTPELTARHVAPEKIVYLELQAGQTALLHNWLLHASDVNRTEKPRRAFSVCYMPASTHTQKGETFPVIFDEGVLRPAI